MADQNFMDLASKTASGIAGTDYMMLVNNSEAYKALVNDVAEAILGKLTSKSFSGLETTAKNVIGALNELNSKSLKYIATLGPGDSESLDSYIPADGHPAGFYRLNGVSIGEQNNLYGSMLLLGIESSKSSTTQVYITSSMILVRTYVGNPLQWSRLMKYTGEILS